MTAELYTAEDVFYELSAIRDPERENCTLAELDVVALDRCSVEYRHHDGLNTGFNNCCNNRFCTLKKPIALVRVLLKPTVPHCSLMALICLCIHTKLKEALPPWMCDWKLDIRLVDGSHVQQYELEKQVADKERVAAALENEALVKEIWRLIDSNG